MNPSLAFVCVATVAALAAFQVQAQDYDRLNQQANLQNGMAPPAAYLNAAELAAPVAGAEFGAHARHQAEQVMQQALHQHQPQRQHGNLGAHLRELGSIGLTSGRRALAEAKPTLEHIRSDLGQYANRVRQNPHLSKVYQVAGPRVKQAMARAQPMVASHTKRLGSMASSAHARMQARVGQLRKQQQQQQQQQQQHAVNPNYPQETAPYEPASVYPMAPMANAHY